VNPVAQPTERDARWGELVAMETRLLRRLARRFQELSVDQLRELIRDAQLDLIEKWESGKVDWPGNPGRWLERAAIRDGLDLLKTTRRRDTKAAGAPDTDFESGVAAAAEVVHEHVLAEENALGLYVLLSPTQRHIALLRFSASMGPKEIAEHLKLSRRTVYRHLDAITARLRAPTAELIDGEFPSAWDELITGHVAGTLTTRDQAKAAALLQANSDAQLFALGLQRAGEQVAALVPPAALLSPTASSNRLARTVDRLGDLAAGMRDAIENSLAAVKHHVATLAGRAAEAAPAIASTRSGAGALLASCVLASGGTVCVITGTTPGDLGDIFGQQPKAKIARKAPERTPTRAAVTATSRPAPAPKPKPRPRPRVAPARSAQQAATPAPNQAAPSPAPSSVTGDFGAQPEAPAQPAPAPTDGPGPFGP
jgi:RNA polymerase sigma factor (sigma-70 family)